jgi:hypothetical protein
MFNVPNSFNLGPGETSTSENNVCLSSSKELLCEYKWLIFLDSRGLERDCSIDRTLLYKLCSSFDEQEDSYLVVSRPKNITVFATLVNFINLNDIQFKNLITNLGFVDSTPKKNVFISDIEAQINIHFSHKQDKYTFPQYLNSEDELINLYSLTYSDNYINWIAKLLNSSFIERYLITTAVIDPSLKFKRQRPDCFYGQLNVANTIINRVCTQSSSTLLDVSALSLSTIDGVHFNEYAHEMLGANIINWLLRNDLVL